MPRPEFWRDAPSGKDGEQRYAYPLGTASPEDTVTQIYAEKFVEEVDRLSEGRIKITVYPNSVLGGDRELLESCYDGDIPFVIQNTAPQVSFIDDTAVFDAPVSSATSSRSGRQWISRNSWKRCRSLTGNLDLNSWDMRIRGSASCPRTSLSGSSLTLKDRRSGPWKMPISSLSGSSWVQIDADELQRSLYRTSAAYH